MTGGRTCGAVGEVFCLSGVSVASGHTVSRRIRGGRAVFIFVIEPLYRGLAPHSRPNLAWANR